MVTELLIALIVAWIYLTIVRFVDVYEREPLWALGTAFALGTGRGRPRSRADRSGRSPNDDLGTDRRRR